MIWRTEEGHPYTKVVEVYGKHVDSSGDEWKEVCEARSILAVPLDGRRRHMELIAKKRSGGDKTVEATVMSKLESAVTAEWKWRRDQKARTEAAA